MATKSIRFKFPSETANVIVRWFENTAPLAEVGRQVFAYPSYVTPVWVVAQGLNPVVHTFEFWRSANGTSLDLLLDTIDVDASISSQVVVDRFEYIVDRGYTNVTQGTGTEVWSDPIAGTNLLNDQRLKGATQDELSVQMRGLGDLQNGEYSIIPVGGIQLSGNSFSSGDTIIIRRYKQIQTQVQSSTNTGSYSDVQVVSADGNFDTTFNNKNNLAGFTSTIGTTVFPDFNLIPNKTKARFATHTGAQRYWKLQLAAGNTVRLAGKDRNVIYMGKDEELELFFNAGVCYVLYYKGYYDSVGEYLLANKPLVNTIAGDGAEYAITAFQRLIDELKAEQIVSYSDYDASVSKTIGNITKTYYPNRGKFAIDPIAGKFKTPDLRGFTPRILKLFSGIDADRLSQGAGSIQTMQIVSHEHDMPNANSQAGFGKPTTGGDGQEGPNLKVNPTGGTEQRVDNYGQYGLIRI